MKLLPSDIKNFKDATKYLEELVSEFKDVKKKQRVRKSKKIITRVKKVKRRYA